MDAYGLDWANLLLRLLHVTAAIAWIGSSFYFVFLDASLEPPRDDALRSKGVSGEMWAVHGGGFYNPQKYAVGPRALPPGKLHWFYWESYTTWLSGIALFAVLYLWNASSFLVDKEVHDWPPTVAAAAAVAFLAVGWFVYDGICRVFECAKDGSIGGDARASASIVAFVAFAAWLACELFAGRAAFIIVGAMLATIMSANVLFRIIPGQRAVVADIAAGRTPDPLHGQRGRQRSVHNTYLTLPVLVAMLGNHYPMLYQHRRNALALVGLMLAGTLVRRFFVLRHRGRPRWSLWGAASLLVAGVAALVAPRGGATAKGGAAPSFAQVQAIVGQRCTACHNARLAQKGLRLDAPELVARNAAAIYRQAVVTRQMPLNNGTGITDDERALLGRWFESGAPTR